MKLSYSELISPLPIKVQGVGGILSVKLIDIYVLGIDIYYYYLTVLSLNLKKYFSLIVQNEEEYEKLSEEQKENLTVFKLLISDEDTIMLLQNVLNFFIQEDVIWSDQYHCFLVHKNNEIIGTISNENYLQVCNLISQRNCFKSDVEEDLSKIKSKKALEIMKKLQKGRAEKAKATKTDKNMELGNIISAVANKSHSLNILNIWNITIFQLWDSFSRQTNNNIYDINSMSVAAWGNKDNHFDANAWFKRIDNAN